MMFGKWIQQILLRGEFDMKHRAILITSLVCLVFFTAPSFALGAAGTIDVAKLKKLYGPYVARIYQNVPGLPLFDVESKDKLMIYYRRDDKPCSEIFLRENPDMAEDCKKVREELTYVNKHKNAVRVHIKGGKVTSTEITTPFEEKSPIKTRGVIILHDALIVHDCVMDRYSRNLATIYHFPGVKPSLEFDKNHNLLLRIGQSDLIKFQAENFRKTDAQGFRLTCNPKYRQKGTRAVPDISYLGKRPHMVTVNWSYPPLTGHFTLYSGSKRIGKVPTSLLYKRLKNDRAQPLFADEGLYNYLKRRYEDGTLKKRYGEAAHQFVETLIVAQGS
jgi:hypothetical protein